MTTALLIGLAGLVVIDAIIVALGRVLARRKETRILREADLHARLRLGEIDQREARVRNG
jgi:hypothetical protein